MPKIRIVPRPRSQGPRTAFWKLVTSVDVSGTNGYAVLGRFLRDGTATEVDVGAVIAQKRPVGRGNTASSVWEFGRVRSDGTVQWGEAYPVRDFLTFRDVLAAELARVPEEESTETTRLRRRRQRLRGELDTLDARIRHLETGASE